MNNDSRIPLLISSIDNQLKLIDIFERSDMREHADNCRVIIKENEEFIKQIYELPNNIPSDSNKGQV